MPKQLIIDGTAIEVDQSVDAIVEQYVAGLGSSSQETR